MASSSSSRLARICTNCKSVSAEFHLGWRLCSGAYAKLCNRCWSAYQDGSFCRTFHLNVAGWRTCARCQTPIHCSCVMSFYCYVRTDNGAVTCKDCYESLVAVEKQRLSLHPTISKMLQRSIAAPPRTTNAVASSSAETEAPTTDLPADPPAQMQAAPQGIGARFSGPPGRRRGALVPDASGWVPLHPRYSACATRGNPLNTESKVLVLERRLSAKDANPEVGSITVPKKIAETYFCKLSPRQSATVAIEDKEGVDWELFLSMEQKGNRLMYTLEGLGHFISSGQCKAGDKVTIHMVEESKKLIIGFVDGSA